MKKPVLFLTLFIVLLLAACGRTTEIDLAEYIHYETGGVNGKGKMFLSVDERMYADAAAKNEKLSVDALRKIVEQDVTLSAAKDRLLSNGDEVEIKIACVSKVCGFIKIACVAKVCGFIKIACIAKVFC